MIAPTADRTRFADGAGASAARIVDAVAELPTGLPLPPAARDRLTAAAHEARDLAALAEASGAGAIAAVGRALAAVADGVVDGGVPFEGLPYLASAADALVQACARVGRGAAPAGDADRSLIAARFELESLLPARGARPAAPSAPDVPLSALRRAERP